jgi:hypothetical protein
MKTYTVTVVTKFYKNIEVEAQDYESAKDAAWDWIERHDALHNADADTELHDIEELLS